MDLPFREKPPLKLINDSFIARLLILTVEAVGNRKLKIVYNLYYYNIINYYKM
jgi:hypothetical protein